MTDDRLIEAPPPIPPGAFRIDRDGTWLHEGVEVTHPGVLRNLYANLRVDAGGHYLQVGPTRIPVEVADAPFVVERVEIDRRDGVLRVHLNDGSVESLDPGLLTFDQRNVPHCPVKGGVFRARLSLAAWLQLAARVELDPVTDEPVLTLGGRRVVVPLPE